jgi:hypothetical protein
MQELSTEEMTSLRGGAHHGRNLAEVLSFGNVAIAMPIDISVLSGSGNVSQVAEAKAGTQLLNLVGL